MRKTAIVAVGAVLALALGGCAGTAEEEASAGPVTISWSHWATGAPPFQAFLDIVDDFNNSQENITVDVVNVPYADYATTIFTQLGAGEGPTIVSVEDYELGRTLEAGLALDLTDKLELPDNLSSWDDRFIVDNKRMAVGYTAHPYQLLVNRGALDALGMDVPTTYEEFLDIAEAATNGSDGFGFAFRSSQAEAAGWWLDLTNWVVGAGGTWTDDSGKPLIDSPEVTTAVERMKYFIDNKLVPTGTDAPTYRRAFSEGKIPMLIESLAMGSILASQTPALADNLEVYDLPFGSDEYMQTTHAMFVNAAASQAEQDAAVTFLNYLFQEDVQEQMVATMGGSLAAIDIPIPPAAVEQWPWLDGWTPSGPSVSSTPVGAEAEFIDLRTIVLAYVEKIFAGQVSVEDGLAAAQAEAEALLGR